MQQLWLKQLSLDGFKNYEHAKAEFCEEVNCFVGSNGAGKTNMLDAMYYLSFTKSFFNAQDQQNIRQGDELLAVEGLFIRNGSEEQVRLVVQKASKKILRVNNNDQKKFSAHIGSYPLVMITPNDIMLVHEGSEERRKFMDGMISQMDKLYLDHLLMYNRLLEQRNRQLKLFAENGYVDDTLLETYDEQLVTYGQFLFEKRKMFLEEFIPVFASYYKHISGSDEEAGLVYESDLHQHTLKEWFAANRSNDLAAQRTTKGIHKDELDFTMKGMSLKKFGSQGQQKSFIISLKLAQYAYLKDKTGVKPLLLLDDIFEKLDEQRLDKLLTMIADDRFGQIFISDTHIDRLKKVFSGMNVQVKYFLIETGSISDL